MTSTPREVARVPATSPARRMTARQMLNKVPEITVYFWVIKVLCTTVGETAADYLSDNVGLGLTNTTWVMSAVLVLVLVLAVLAPALRPVRLLARRGAHQRRRDADHRQPDRQLRRLARDQHDRLSRSRSPSTFAVWYRFERTLSIHTIVTTRREAFYWLAVLFTFALGTAAGDLTAERLGIGYWQSALIFGGMIAVVYVAHVRFALNAILAFWIAYILTRPLGASIGDYLSQPKADGGLGLGTTVTSVIFLSAILATVVFLTITKRDQIESAPMPSAAARPGTARVLVVTNKTAATPALVEAVRERAATGPAEFVMLVPNPAHLPFDRPSPDRAQAEHLLGDSLPLLERAAGSQVEGRVAASPNAFDDIMAELGRGEYSEIILETVPTHVSHWLHVDLSQRLAGLGYALTTIPATH